MKKTLCSVLVIALMAAATPMAAADKPEKTDAATVAVKVAPLAGALKEAGPKVTLTAAAPAESATSTVPRSLPRTGSDRIRKQGGGGMGMVVGLVSTLVGVGATVYMVKQMKKTSDDNK